MEDAIVKIRLTLTGTSPLLMHNVRLANPIDPYAKRLAELQGKRGKDRTDADYLEIFRAEWEGSFYLHDQLGPYLASAMVLRSLLDGARRIRLGKKIERGFRFTEFLQPLIYDGPRQLDDLWDAGFYDIRPVKVGMSRVVRCRPRFNDWKIEADAILDPQEIDVEDVARIAPLAGREGIGDFRLHHGHYDAEVQQL